MNIITKNILKISLVFLILFVAVFSISKIVNIDSIQVQNLTAEKPLFGADEYDYVAPKDKTGENPYSSAINWSITLLTLLIIFVIANVLDINKYISKITGKETISLSKINKWLMLIIMIVGLVAVAWEYKVHGKLILLNNSASEHGASYDSMFTITLVLTTIVFVITQFLLFWFSFRYAERKGEKALYYAHNNKLEVFWTIIPSIVLTILVLRGHQTWKSVVYAEDDYNGTVKKIEVFGYQFGWKARYPGNDGELGKADYKFISGKNDLGLAYLPEVDALLLELERKIKEDQNAIEALNTTTLEQAKRDLHSADSLKDSKGREPFVKIIEDIKSGAAKDELEASIKRKTKQYERIIAIKKDKTQFASYFNNKAEDDIITQELHLVKDSLISLHFRAKDVIHSAWLPHFRAQMNVVPGMPTKFTFKPNKSTKDAKIEFGPDFDYYLYCNKICGTSHYGMKIKVVVESLAEVNDWLRSQPVAFAKPAPAYTAPVATPSDTTTKVGEKLVIK